MSFVVVGDVKWIVLYCTVDYEKFNATVYKSMRDAPQRFGFQSEVNNNNDNNESCPPATCVKLVERQKAPDGRPEGGGGGGGSRRTCLRASAVRKQLLQLTTHLVRTGAEGEFSAIQFIRFLVSFHEEFMRFTFISFIIQTC